jgi:hypothetical protein
VRETEARGSERQVVVYEAETLLASGDAHGRAERAEDAIDIGECISVLLEVRQVEEMFLELRVPDAGGAPCDDDHAGNGFIGEKQREQFAAGEARRAEEENAGAFHPYSLRINCAWQGAPTHV